MVTGEGLLSDSTTYWSMNFPPLGKDARLEYPAATTSQSLLRSNVASALRDADGTSAWLERPFVGCQSALECAGTTPIWARPDGGDCVLIERPCLPAGWTSCATPNLEVPSTSCP